MGERQLHLFKSKRQRGVEPKPRAKEYELHCMVAEVLRRWLHPLWLYTHMPMGEKREPATAMRLKRMGVTPGWGDFVLFGPGSRVVWLELKRPGVPARVSKEQELLADKLVLLGHVHIVTNDFREAIDLLRDMGIVRSMVST